MSNPFETPNKRNFPGDFKTPASVAPPRRPNFGAYPSNTDFGSRNLYPDIGHYQQQHQDDGLPQELSTPSRSQSYNPYGGSATTPEMGGGMSGGVSGGGAGGGVGMGRSVNALVQQQSVEVMPTQMREAIDKTLGPVQLAAKTIHGLLDKDAMYPALDEIVGQGSSGEYEVGPDYAPEPFYRVAQHMLPDSVFDQYNSASNSTLMGLFPEVKQAYITVDNRLYMWDYATGTEFQAYESQPHTIVAVKMLKPKAGVFITSVDFVLVIATTVDIFLLGVGAQDNGRGAYELTIYNTQMSVSTKGQVVTLIEGSRTSGRIFYAVRDENNIYEFTYQSDEGWFRGRCQKVCHTNGGLAMGSRLLWFAQQKDTEQVEQIVIDDTRNMLYTLSSASSIRAFQMRPDNGLALQIRFPFTSALANMRVLGVSSMSFGADTKIIGISAVNQAQAKRTHLVATTVSGVRLFISAVGSEYQGDAFPTTMQITHVRYPPPGAKIPNNVRYAKVFTPGYSFSFMQESELEDTMLITAPDSAKINQQFQENGNRGAQLIEQGALIRLESRVESVELVKGAFSASKTPQGFGNEASTQYDLKPTEIAILTNSGIHVYKRRRLVDILEGILRSENGNRNLIDPDVRKFFDTYGRTEACAACLAIACGANIFEATKVADFEIASAAGHYFIEFGGRPTATRAYDSLSAPRPEDIQVSGRADAIGLHIARCVRSIWKSPVIAVGKGPNGGPTYSSSINTTKLREIHGQLLKLKKWLDDKKSSIPGMIPLNIYAKSKMEEVSDQAENRMLNALTILILGITEGISFVLFLFEANLDEIVLSLSPDERLQLLNLTYGMLFSSTLGKDLAKTLVTAIVNRGINAGGNVDAIANQLRDKCGSFCSSDDVLVFKAIEYLRKANEASEQGDVDTKMRMLRESLRLFEQTAQSLNEENLRETVNEYRKLEFYQGAVQLLLVVAKEIDPSGLADRFCKEDAEGVQGIAVEKYHKRRECYNLIFEVLADLENALVSQPLMLDGVPSPATRVRNETWSTLYSTNDKLFHYELYDWMFANHLSERLLQIENDYIKGYLEHRGMESITHADFLWQYHSRRHDFFEAAKVLHELALSEFRLNLKQRLEYMGRAKTMCMSQAAPGKRAEMNALAAEVAEELEVAMIQDDIVARLNTDPRIAEEKKRKLTDELDFTLVNLTNLYNKYAEPYEYFDVCLSIFQAADHRALPEIKACWAAMFDSLHHSHLLSQPSPPTSTSAHELISERVITLGRRFLLSEYIFPPQIVLPLLEAYNIQYASKPPNQAPANWVVGCMLEAGVSEEILLRTLEDMFYRNEVPVEGEKRKVLVLDAVAVVERWWKGVRVEYGGEGFNRERVVGTIRAMAGEVGGSLSVLERDRVEAVCREVMRRGGYY